MSVYVDPIHGKAYANDPWYDAMRGRIVQQYTVTGITDDGWVVRHTRTVLDFGRVPPPTVDPNEAIGDLSDDSPDRKPQAKTVPLLESIYDALSEQPMNARQLAHATGATVNRIQAILRDHSTGLVILAKCAWGHVYGLEGCDYPPVYSATMQRIVDYLREHGPTSTPDLCAALNMHKPSIFEAIRKHPGAVVEAGTQAAQGTGGKRALVWDVAR